MKQWTIAVALAAVAAVSAGVMAQQRQRAAGDDGPGQRARVLHRGAAPGATAPFCLSETGS